MGASTMVQDAAVSIKTTPTIGQRTTNQDNANKAMSAEIQCSFEKALVSGANECAQARRVEIGERIVCLCRSPEAARRCERYLSLVRQNARFVFRQIRSADSILSNYQELCLQCGGLQGLSAINRDAQENGKRDVNILLQTTEDQYGDFENIPMDQIVPRIAAYNPRPHRKRK